MAGTAETDPDLNKSDGVVSNNDNENNQTLSKGLGIFA